MRLVILIIANLAFAIVQAQDRDQVRCATDIVILIDQSSSITRSNYAESILPFLQTLVDGLHIDPNEDRVAFVPFSDPELTKVSFHFNQYSTADEVKAAIQNEKFRGGNTATRKALELARDSVFDESNGARNTSYKLNVAPTLLIITDGVATDIDPASVAAELRSRGISLFAVKVGSLLNESYLIEITGDGKRVFAAEDYADLKKELVDAIIASTTVCAHRNGVFRGK